MTKKNNVLIEYKAIKDNRYEKCYRVNVWINGQWIYTFGQSRKTQTGATKLAKRVAQNQAKSFPELYNNITITERV